ncbi:hypothetical protein N5F13_20985 [Comamonas thiooxydans]|uniref:hypothetical protein n=1 Tax=Comamonas thiooxydans TaxID=363952 RepID=UPI00244B707A|nr:hypothetical protein [Comamonas thiooxydans]MDH1476981.1 hypothetical protein [Comamonas thiooxydans]
MKETGLMFKAPLVRDILSDLKTQTRRAFSEHMMKQMRAAAAIGEVSHFLNEGSLQPNDLAYVQQFSPVGQPGDRIYVRETWQGPLMSAKEWEDHYFSKADELPSKFKTPAYCKYAADGGAPPEFMTMDDDIVARWKPSIHMPKWAARIWLEITGLRVERLQSISRGDAMAEGCPVPNMADGEDPRDWFAEVWKSTGGDWAANPWVWVIDFKRIEKPR